MPTTHTYTRYTTSCSRGSPAITQPRSGVNHGCSAVVCNVSVLIWLVLEVGGPCGPCAPRSASCCLVSVAAWVGSSETVCSVRSMRSLSWLTQTCSTVCVLALPVVLSYAVTWSPTLSVPIGCSALGFATAVAAEEEQPASAPRIILPANPLTRL